MLLCTAPTFPEMTSVDSGSVKDTNTTGCYFILSWNAHYPFHFSCHCNSNNLCFMNKLFYLKILYDTQASAVIFFCLSVLERNLNRKLIYWSVGRIYARVQWIVWFLFHLFFFNHFKDISVYDEESWPRSYSKLFLKVEITQILQ